MFKKWLAFCLCVCLLLPTVTLGVQVSAENGYVLQDLGYKVSGVKTAGANGSLIADPLTFADAINFNSLGYADGTLGLQLDLFASGDMTMLKAAVGQIEFTSSGAVDQQEINYSINNLKWEADQWVRQVIPLSAFGEDPALGKFNPANVNFMRIYFVGVGAYAGAQVVMKICNVRLVDMTKTAPSVEEDPIGDGSFMPDPPVWEQVTFSEGFERDEVIVAGYRLDDYLAPGTDKDATPVIQSLLDGLEMAGGGTLFIPAGEYICEGELLIPTGVTMCGEWRNPDEFKGATGTILKIYGGKGDKNAPAFITMGTNCMVRDMTFWYPEQIFDVPIVYPATVRGGSYCHVKNVTFVNSYFAYQQGPTMSGCPNVTNVYGTPLNVGLDCDGIADIGRFDEVHFSPKYWIESGLAGAPVTEDEREELREWLYYYAIGFIMRRIDWSYLTYSDVEGYNVGLYFDMSYCTECYTNGERTAFSFPNGHCYGLTFDTCQFGIYTVGVSGSGETISDVVIRNAEYGVWLADSDIAEGGNIQFANMDIEASEYAFYNKGVIKSTIINSVIREGIYGADNGVMTLVNTQFLTDAPQVVLERGTCTAILLENTDANGDPIKVDNQGLCPISNDPTGLDMTEVESLSVEDAAEQFKGPSRAVAYIANIDATGASDVTAALQALLDKASNEGGGTVFLPPGTYRLNGNITIPSGVELKGSCDLGRIPYQVGSILAIYGGVNDANGDPTIVLEANAGIRGFAIDYPQQHPYAPSIVQYPYVIQGRGENVYVVNVAIRNGYNGVDFMTYRCDNHYIDYMSGMCVNNSIQVGGGSVGGVIRNYQFNYNAMLHGASAGWGAWENAPDDASRNQFEQTMKQHSQNYGVILRLGDVTDQIVFNSFSYSGGIGVEFVEEDGQAPNALLVGHGCDFATVAIDVKAAESVQFVNLQLTSFNGIGDALQNKMYDVHLGKDLNGDVTIVNLTMWAQPDKTLCIENGTLNVYGCNFSTNNTDLAEISDNGTLNIIGCSVNRGGDVVVAAENLGRIHLNGVIYLERVVDKEKFGTFKNAHYRVTRWDSPDNAEFDPNSSMLFTESFTDYEIVGAGATFNAEIGTGKGETMAFATLNGEVRLLLDATAQNVAIRNKTIEMTGGKSDSLYRLETRIRIDSMRENEFSQILMLTYNKTTRPTKMAIFSYGEGFMVDGRKLADFAYDTWYRVAFEIDTRDVRNKTYRVFLMDDSYNVLAASAAIPFASSYQTENAIASGFWVGALADSEEGDDTTTDVLVDYVFVTYSEESTFGAVLGDVDSNGKVNTTDARKILQFAAETIGSSALDLSCADVDGDGKVNTTDARKILQYTAGLITSF